MRALQITRFGGPEVLDIVDLPDPVPGEGQLYEVHTAGVNFADTHQALSRDVDQRHSVVGGLSTRSSSEMPRRFEAAP
jgi:NADPH:quinone reductase-like Zn-dependent oxidoreductase